MKKPIYLDYAATTPVDPRVAAKMWQFLTLDGVFGNPSSNTHIYGLEAKKAVEQARQQVAALLNADADEIVWTSGATEADNLAITGAARFRKNRGRHIITAQTEHKAVLDTCRVLQKEGFDVTYLRPDSKGLVSLQQIREAVRQDTILVSLMHVNNEIGVIQDIQSIATWCRERQIYFHVDAAQSAGKVPIDVKTMPVDLMSVSAHKVYGPKGIGALYVRRKPRVRLEPLIYGGGHEQGLRSGTLATHQIVGMGEAFAIAREELSAESRHLLALRHKLWKGIRDLPGVHLNGDEDKRVAGNLNFSVEGVEGTSLLYAVADLAVSTGSACTSATVEPSHVLRALGVDDRLAHGTLRVSMGRFTTEAEIDYAIAHLRAGIQWLRSLSPLWKEAT